MAGENTKALVNIKRHIKSAKSILHYGGGVTVTAVDPEDLDQLDLILSEIMAEVNPLPSLKNSSLGIELGYIQVLLPSRPSSGKFTRPLDRADLLQRIYDCLGCALQDAKVHPSVEAERRQAALAKIKPIARTTNRRPRG